MVKGHHCDKTDSEMTPRPPRVWKTSQRIPLLNMIIFFNKDSFLEGKGKSLAFKISSKRKRQELFVLI